MNEFDELYFCANFVPLAQKVLAFEAVQWTYGCFENDALHVILIV